MQYASEHLNCLYYANDKSQTLFVRTLREGEYMTLDSDAVNMLLFIIDGEIRINIGRFRNATVVRHRLFFAESGNGVLIKAVCPTTIMWCTIKEQMTLCNGYSLQDLIRHYKKNRRRLGVRETEMFTLPVNSELEKELDATYNTLKGGMLCIHYQKLKINVLMMLLRAFTPKDELVRLFRPILNEENDFKLAVQAAYNDQINVQELMAVLDMPESTFNRKFVKVFGMTAGKYITQRKKDQVLRELLMTDLSVKEISEKFKFTPGYIVKFSKTYFGKTPTELRAERNRQ